MGFNPQQIREMRERNEQRRAKELAAIAAGTMQDPRLSIQFAGPLSASARKFQQEQFKKVIGPLSPTHEAQIIRSTIAFDQKIREVDRIQAEQRARAGAVGARSEAVKQQEQRAVAASQGTILGSISKAPVSSAQPTPPKDTGPKVIKVKLSDSVQATSNFGGSVETRAPIPKGAAYFVLGGGEPGVFAIGKPDYKTPNVFGPQEKPEQQGPREDYPLTFENLFKHPDVFLKGGYEIGAKGLALSIITPRPIISDILGTTDDKRIGKIVKEQSEFIKPAESYYSKELIPAISEVRYPRPPTVFESGGIAFDIGTVVAPIKSPFKGTSIKLPLGEAKATTVYKGIVVEFGSKSQPLIGKAGSKIVIGTPKAEVLGLEKLQPTGRGLEIGSGSTLEQKILTKPDVLKVAGFGEREIERASTIKAIAKLGSKAKTKVFSKTFGEQPISSLKPGKETTTAIEFLGEKQSKIIGKIPAVKGGLAQKPQLLPDYARTTSDIDIDIGSVPKGRSLALEFAERESTIAGVGRKFKAEKAKVYVESKGGREKVAEFLTKDDIDQDTSSLNKNIKRVFGVRTSKKSIRVEGVKLTILKQQGLRKAASVGSIQGPKTEGFAGTGKLDLTIEPPPFRQKDITDLFAISKTQATVLGGSKGTELNRLAEKLKMLYPDIDFDKPFKGLGETIEFEKGRSVFGSIYSTIAEPRFTGSTSPIIKQPTEKEPSIFSKSSKQTISKLDSLFSNYNIGKSSNLNSLSNSISRISRSSVQQQSPLNRSYSQNPLKKSNYSSILKPSKGSSLIGSPFKGSPKSPISPIIPISPGSPITLRKPPGKPPASPITLSGLSTYNPIPTNIPPINIKAGIFFAKQKQKRTRRVPARSKQRIFIADVPDPLRAGVILPAGVKPLYARSRRGGFQIFKKIDISLGKARRSKYAIRPLGI